MLCLFLVLFIKCNDHCSNYTPIKKCSDIVLNIHTRSSCLLRCCGLFITMLSIDLSLQIAMFLLPSEHTLPAFSSFHLQKMLCTFSSSSSVFQLQLRKNIILFSQFTSTKALMVPGLCSQALQQDLCPCFVKPRGRNLSHQQQSLSVPGPQECY